MNIFNYFLIFFLVCKFIFFENVGRYLNSASNILFYILRLINPASRTKFRFTKVAKFLRENRVLKMVLSKFSEAWRLFQKSTSNKLLEKKFLFPIRQKVLRKTNMTLQIFLFCETCLSVLHQFSASSCKSKPKKLIVCVAKYNKSNIWKYGKDMLREI